MIDSEADKIANASLHQRAELMAENERLRDLIEALRVERIKLQAEVEKLRFMQFKQQTEGSEEQ